ncbi:MAG: PKD domain-containing protein [Bacteroidota bacterium]
MISLKYRHLFLALCLCFTALDTLFGRHIIGGELTYECLGVNASDTTLMDYRFTMTVYRDCSTDGGPNQGAGFDSDSGSPTPTLIGTVTIYRGSSSIPFIASIDLAQPDVADVLPDIGNPCLILPPNVCVERGIYVFERSLPISDETYTVAYQRCCRNQSIDNLVNPGGVGATYSIEITPEAQQLCNNSPVFVNFPPIVLCAQEPFELDLSAEDAEGDSLFYYFCSPTVGGGPNGMPGQSTTFVGVAPDPDSPPPYGPVAFSNPFNFEEPLGPDGAFLYDPITGLLSGTPPMLGQYVVGICIDEFRGDTLLSTTKREFQFNIAACERAVFADLREDSITPDGRFVIDVCGPGDFTIFNESTLEQFITTYNWTLSTGATDTIFGENRDLVATINETGTYEGIMILNRESNFNCSDTALFEINIFPELIPDFAFDYDTCIAGPVSFTDSSFSAEDVPIINYLWNFGDGSPPGTSQDLQHLYIRPDDFPVSLTVTDSNLCQASITKPVRYFPVPQTIFLNPSTLTGCEPTDLLFVNASIPVDETYDVLWEFGDGGTSTELNPTYQYEEAGVYDVYLSLTSPIGCFTDTIFPNLIDIQESPTAGFSFSPTNPSNLERDVFIEDESQEAIAWLYDVGGFFQTQAPNFTYTFRDTGLVAITQYVTHPSGCIDSLTQFIDIEPIITFFMPNAFTPNGDGLNDDLFPKAFLFGYRDYRFSVWNRWGQMIFTTNDPDAGWNGTFGGRDSPGGAYLWEAEITGPRGKVERYKGTATLLR